MYEDKTLVKKIYLQRQIVQSQDEGQYINLCLPKCVQLIINELLWADIKIDKEEQTIILLCSMLDL